MSTRSRQTVSSPFVILTGLALTALGARTVRASDEDPFAGDQPSKAARAPVADPGEPGPQKQGPPAAPEEPAPAGPAIVQELPASAYPEPMRGVYGGSLWLDMQGLQWPYMSQTGIGLSGYGWLDNMYKKTRIGDPNQSDHTTKLFQQGRFLFRVTPTYTNGSWFVQAQAEVVANKDQVDAQSSGLVDADDVWVRTGSWQRWDVTVGRFQAFDVYPLGMGLDLNTDERLGAYDGVNSPTQLYAADFLFYRPAGPGDIAVHLYPIGPLRLEILAQWGNTGSENSIGARPAAILDLGVVKLRGALEYQYEFAQDPSTQAQNTIKNRGGAGSVQFVLTPYLEAGVNFGYAVIDVTDAKSSNQPDNGLSGNKTSFGGFANFAPLPNVILAGGGNYTTFHDLNFITNTQKYEQSTNLQVYGALQYLLYKQLFVKLVVGYAKSHFENRTIANPYDDDMYSARLRVMYLF